MASQPGESTPAFTSLNSCAQSWDLNLSPDSWPKKLAGPKKRQEAVAVAVADADGDADAVADAVAVAVAFAATDAATDDATCRVVSQIN